MSLTDTELARIRADHTRVYDQCWSCTDLGTGKAHAWPCDAALLLTHFAPGPVPHLAGLAYGLLGPVSSEELAQ